MENKILTISLLISLVVHLGIALPIGRFSHLFVDRPPEEQFIELLYKDTEHMVIPQMPEEPPKPEEPSIEEELIEEIAPETTPITEEIKPVFDIEPETVPEPEPEPEPEPVPEPDEELEKQKQEEIEKQKEELQKKVDEIDQKVEQTEELDVNDLAKIIVTYADVLREFITVNFNLSNIQKQAVLQELGTASTSVHVYFVLMSDGSLIDIYIPDMYKSKSELFNSLAIQAIKEASKRFPNFPKTYTKDVETFEIVFSISSNKIPK